jgi:anti-anti-sigma factor
MIFIKKLSALLDNAEVLMEMSVTQSNKLKVIKLAGKISWEDAQRLDTKIKEIIEEGFHQIVFNLDDVRFICSGGIGALIYNLNQVKKHNGCMYLISSSEYVNFIFETLKFDVVFDGFLFKSYEEFCEKVVDRKIPA